MILMYDTHYLLHIVIEKDTLNDVHDFYCIGQIVQISNYSVDVLISYRSSNRVRHFLLNDIKHAYCLEDLEPLKGFINE